MKFLKNSGSLIREVEKAQGHDEGRRSALSKIVAAMATFSTGLLVSNSAHATCYCNNQSCSVQSGQCVSPQGLCYDDFYEQYFYVYDVYYGSPNFQCCAEVTALACYDVCNEWPIC